MANTFKRITASEIGTTEIVMYTVPPSTTTVIIGFTVSNLIGMDVTVDAKVGGVHLGKTLPVPKGGTLSLLVNKMVLESADSVAILSSSGLSLDGYLSIMEIT